ncbi:phage major capsid protein, HK97 family [Marininema mesophilum]|uniref:Phage major capsid protein, HK97 family n=1 Tax=Marininema mesophilum TaxID=1048340 RepID=A0A1H3BTU2_9BACL|nr:phage major capsid protein [Marininema mesophilum]SDX45236.1 phage major capsid protein, HK97 family [Marininema mesophilum]
MKNVLEMRQKRAALVKQAREVLDKVEQEKREMTAEEEQHYETIMAEVDKRAKEIEREERMSGIEADLKETLTPANRPDPQPPEERKRMQEREAYRKAFWEAIRQDRNALSAEQLALLQDPEVRALATATNTAGGYLVPTEFEKTLIQKLLPFNVMRSLCKVITTNAPNQIPVETDFGAATWLAENAVFTESDAKFGQTTLSAYKLGTIIKVSEELLNDSVFSIDEYVADAFARRFGVAEEAAFVNGDGTGKPTGIINGATPGKVAAIGNTTSITTDDLFDTFHALGRPYRTNATWLFSDGTAKAIRKLKDNTGQYLWTPGLQAGQPDRILARPVAISDFVPAMAANAKSMLFGDFSYYWIADRQGRVMQRLTELYAANGQVGFRMYQRTDGKLILPDAVVYFQNSAT